MKCSNGPSGDDLGQDWSVLAVVWSGFEMLELSGERNSLMQLKKSF